MALVVGGGLTVVALIVGLLVYGEMREPPAPGPGAPASSALNATTPEPVPEPASLWVTADPAGSMVLIDGHSAGAAPLWVNGVAHGERSVRVVGPGGGTVADTTIWVEGGSVTDLDLSEGGASALGGTGAAGTVAGTATRGPTADRPVTEGGLRVTSTPSGARVVLDGRRIGTTPLLVDGLEPGRHRVSVGRQGYETAARTVTVHGGEVFEAAVALRPVDAATPARPAEPPAPSASSAPPPPATAGTGVVEVVVRPWGSIAINGTVRIEETDVAYRAELGAGRHRVVASHPELGSDERTVTVTPGSRTRLVFDLVDPAP